MVVTVKVFAVAEEQGSIDERRLFESAVADLAFETSRKCLEVLSIVTASKRNFGQMDHSINQMKFTFGGMPLATTVNPHHSQEMLITRANARGRKNIQAELHGALGD